jgi:hypothetical protein
MTVHYLIAKANEMRGYNPAKACRLVEKFVLHKAYAGQVGAFDLLGQIYLKAGELQSAKSAFLKECEYERLGLPDSTLNYLGLINFICGDKDEEPHLTESSVYYYFDEDYVKVITDSYEKRISQSRPNLDRIRILDGGKLPPPLFPLWWQFWKFL